jgi:hypothetical protein
MSKSASLEPLRFTVELTPLLLLWSVWATRRFGRGLYFSIIDGLRLNVVCRSEENVHERIDPSGLTPTFGTLGHGRR